MPTLASPPTPETIAAEIALLKAMKPNIPEHSLFGESNWAEIEAQLEVLAGNLSTSELERRFGEAAEAGEENTVLTRAQEARAWLDGELAAPSADWKSLAGTAVDFSLLRLAK